MVDPEPRAAPPTPSASRNGDDGGGDHGVGARGERAPRVAVTQEVGPDVEDSALPSDLSAAVGTSELADPLLAAVAAAPPPVAEPELAPGALIGECFRIDRRLGSGGMGVVYLAHDESLDRAVAVKLHRAGGSVDRLQREAMAMARLSHPNVITVHEVGRLGDSVFVAMEFVAGGTLRAWLKARPRPWREILAVCVGAGEGLAAAHDAGLVHRDFKPENVLVGDDGRPRVGDFGLARAIAASRGEVAAPASSVAPAAAPSAAEAITAADTAAPTRAARAGRPSGPTARPAGTTSPGGATAAVASTTEVGEAPTLAQADVEDAARTPASSGGGVVTPGRDAERSQRGLLSDRLTMTGVLMGTPAYMAPEQFADADVDARADQFAFAVMTWEALFGKRPFAGGDAAALRAAVEAGRVLPPPRDTLVPAKVRAALSRALAVEPAARWPSMRALLAELRRAAEPSRGRLWLALGGGGALVAAVAAWALWPAPAAEPCRQAAAGFDAVVPAAMIHRMRAEVAAATGDRELLGRIDRQLARLRPELGEAALASCQAARVERRLPAELEERSRACLTLRARASALLVDAPALLAGDPAAYLSRLRALPSYGPCLDPVALAASAPRHDEASIAARARLWAASADVRADRHAQAAAAAREAEALAAPDDRGARALATVIDGQIAYAQDRLADAARRFADAYYAGVALDDSDVYLEALAHLIHLHGSDRFEVAEAQPWIRAGAAAVERDRRRAPGGVGAVLGALVGAADGRGDSAQAIAWGEELVRMVPPGADAGVRGEAELALARALHGGGRYDEAITRYERAIREHVTALGPTHPRTAQVLGSYGLLLVDAGREDEVAAVVMQVRTALAAWPGARSTDRANALLNLGVLLTDEPANFAEAEAAYREAREIYVRLLGPEHPDVALCDANLAVLENKRGRPREALVALERAIAIQERALGSGHLQVASTSFNIAAAALMAGDHARAEPAAARAEAFFAKLAPGESRHLFAMNLRAHALSGLGHHAAALALASRSNELAGQRGDGPAGLSATVELARALVGLGRDLDRARAYLDAAQPEYERYPEVFARALADIAAIRHDLERRGERR